MLKNTFCHIPRITENAELKLWGQGIHWWEQIETIEPEGFTSGQLAQIRKHINESNQQLNLANAVYFAQLMPTNQHWRLFPDFRHSVAYLDIETTGLGGPGDYITTIALYDGSSIFHYVHGQNLDKFASDIKKYQLIVTYNGKCFDLPFIKNYLKVKIDAAHIDLRYVLKSLGYSGGLKGCEKQLKIDRGKLEGVDGYFAVLLWNEYRNSGNEKALNTLLAYNIEDVVHLEKLLVIAYNKKLKGTPFAKSHRLDSPPTPALPFKADVATIKQIRRKYRWL